VITVGTHHAKTHLSELLRRVASGDEVLILRGRKPVARLVPVEAPAGKRQLGMDSGAYVVPDDFDAPPG
jgi:prevent-host-death family protein